MSVDLYMKVCVRLRPKLYRAGQCECVRSINTEISMQPVMLIEYAVAKHNEQGDWQVLTLSHEKHDSD